MSQKKAKNLEKQFTSVSTAKDSDQGKSINKKKENRGERNVIIYIKG